MIQVVGEITNQHQSMVQQVFEQSNLSIQFVSIDHCSDGPIISLDKQSSKQLTQKAMAFYNWDLLFSTLGPNDSQGETEQKLQQRIAVLKSVMAIKSRPIGEEMHGSIRVNDLANSAGFYTWLFGVEPKEWTHRYVTFVRQDTQFNFVLLVADGKTLHHDTLFHLGMGVSSKQQVVEFYHSAVENGFHIEKPPRTTWRGTPLHELWLKDPDGTLIEIYARLTEQEFAAMPEDKEAVFLV